MAFANFPKFQFSEIPLQECNHPVGDSENVAVLGWKIEKLENSSEVSFLVKEKQGTLEILAPELDAHVSFQGGHVQRAVSFTGSAEETFRVGGALFELDNVTLDCCLEILTWNNTSRTVSRRSVVRTPRLCTEKSLQLA
jgi:hypothetical protein